MNAAALVVGYATMLGLAICALVWLWAKALTAVGGRAMETKEFFQIVVRYARERQKTRVMGIDE